MARALLDAPIHLLVAQATHTAGHLRAMTSVREAMALDGVDVCALEAELAAALAEGREANVALGTVEIEQTNLKERQDDLSKRVREWARELKQRLRLAEVLSPASAKAVKAVRDRLAGDHRWFSFVIADLRGAVPALKAHQAVLARGLGDPDCVARGEELLCEAERLDEERVSLDGSLARLRADREEKRVRLMQLFRKIRIVWATARHRGSAERPVPPMSLAVLKDARRPDGAPRA